LSAVLRFEGGEDNGAYELPKECENALDEAQLRAMAPMEYVSAAGTKPSARKRCGRMRSPAAFIPPIRRRSRQCSTSFLSQASASLAAKPILVPLHDRILAAVAPHAGYPYSGPVAATAYAALQGRNYARVVVVAPSHFDSFDFTSVYDGDAYQTPWAPCRLTRPSPGSLSRWTRRCGFPAMGTTHPGRSRTLDRGRVAVAPKSAGRL